MKLIDYYVYFLLVLSVLFFNSPVSSERLYLKSHLKDHWSVEPEFDLKGFNSISKSGTQYVFRYIGNDCQFGYIYEPSIDIFALSINFNDQKFYPCYQGNINEESLSLYGIPVLVDSSLQCQFNNGSLTVEIKIHQKSLIMTFTGQIKNLYPGKFYRPFILSKTVWFPYNCYQAAVMTEVNNQPVFISSYLDWVYSDAYYGIHKTNIATNSSNTCEYSTRTDSISSRERLYITVSPKIKETFPSVPFKPSEFLDVLATKVVYDDWDGWNRHSFYDDIKVMTALKKYGCDEILWIRHNWQKYGYDVNLPEVYPANNAFGGGAGMSNLGLAAKNYEYLFGLHVNYNPYDTRGHTSLRTNYVNMMEIAIPIENLIHNDYHTSAVFIDVQSGHPPSTLNKPIILPPVLDRYDEVVGLFDTLSVIHQGPAIGEGNQGYLYYAGIIDAVEAELWDWTAGEWDAPGGETPSYWVGRYSSNFMPDFDLYRLHPYQIHQNMGYENRFFNANSNDPVLWGIAIDLTEEQWDMLRALKILFGHVGGVGMMFTTHIDIEEFVKEYYLMMELQSRYLGTGKEVETIKYANRNGPLVSIEEALYNNFQFSDNMLQGYVKWKNGLEIYANLYDKNWNVTIDTCTFTLPRYGWVAFRPETPENFSAFSALINGNRMDYIQSPLYIFIDGRGTQNAFNHITTDGPVIVRYNNGTKEIEVIPLRIGQLWRSPNAAPNISLTKPSLFGLDPFRWDQNAVDEVRGYDKNGNYVGIIPIQKQNSFYQFSMKDDSIFSYRMILSKKTDINEQTSSIPGHFVLFQNYPNPFNNETIISFEVPYLTEVNITVYNILGQKIKKLVSTLKNAGVHKVIWDGTNDDNTKVPSGVYIYQMTTSTNYKKNKKMIILK